MFRCRAMFRADDKSYCRRRWAHTNTCVALGTTANRVGPPPNDGTRRVGGIINRNGCLAPCRAGTTRCSHGGRATRMFGNRRRTCDDRHAIRRFERKRTGARTTTTTGKPEDHGKTIRIVVGGDRDLDVYGRQLGFIVVRRRTCFRYRRRAFFLLLLFLRAAELADNEPRARARPSQTIYV